MKSSKNTSVKSNKDLSAKDLPKKSRSKKAKNPQPPNKFTGLCVNCDKRFVCLHYNQIGGVWYCEEYE
jgi:hypothetical protein